MQGIELKSPSTNEEYLLPAPLGNTQDVQLKRKSTSISTMVGSYSGTTFKANNATDIADLQLGPAQFTWKAQPIQFTWKAQRDALCYTTAEYPNLQHRVDVGNVTKLLQTSISIKTIHSDIGIFILAEPLEVTFEIDEDTYICWNEDFKLYGCGASQREALIELESFFVDIYDSYRNTPESELTKDAKQLLKEFNKRIRMEL